jgi:hypothetical protein
MCGRHAAVTFEPPEAAPPPGQQPGGFLSACEGSWAARAHKAVPRSFLFTAAVTSGSVVRLASFCILLL